MNRLQDDGLAKSTTVILSAKHGQSPVDPDLLRRVDDGVIINDLDAGWTGAHPGAPDLVVFSSDDDGMLLWLSDHRPAAEQFARTYLLTHSAPANTIADPRGTFSASVAASGLRSVYVGRAADHVLAAPAGDTHAPDLVGIAQHGVVYTGKTSKISEHGGDATEDRHVPLVIAGPGARPHTALGQTVRTTQIAPTICVLLGLESGQLQSVRREHTKLLPDLLTH
jgi:arylsulfatase A-like enzyme